MKYQWGEPDQRLVKNGKVMCPRCMKYPARIDQCMGVLPCGNHTTEQMTKGLKDGFLTRNSKRVWDQQDKHAEDFIQPERYNKALRKLEINPDFVKKYPDKVRYYFDKQEVKKQGYGKLATFIERQQEAAKRIKSDVQFEGDEKKGMKRFIK